MSAAEYARKLKDSNPHHRVYLKQWADLNERRKQIDPKLKKQYAIYPADDALWQAWRAYYHFRNLDFGLALMDDYGREAHTVPTEAPEEFDALFNRDRHEAPPDPRKGANLSMKEAIVTAYARMSPEQKAKHAEMMRKFLADDPTATSGRYDFVPDGLTVAEYWDKMAPFWNSGNPAYAGSTKTQSATPSERAAASKAIREKYGMTDEALDKIPDRREYEGKWKTGGSK
jgi:hypothetical protein